MTDSRGIRFDFHGVVTVRAEGVDAAVRSALAAEFRDFVCDPSPEGKDDDVVVGVLNAAQLKSVLPPRIKNIDQFWAGERDGQLCVLYNRHGKPDVLVRLGEPIELRFAARRNAAPNLINALHTCVQLALHRRQAALLKGAAVCRDGGCVVLAGLSSAGKTSLMLHMLHDGWDYLSDNTLILHQGRALGFRRRIVFNEYHVAAYPQLFEAWPAARRTGFGPALRKRLRRFAARHFPPYLLRSQKLKNLYDPFVIKDPAEAFGGRRVVGAARPNAVIVLRSGADFSLRPLSGAERVTKLAAIQELTYPEFETIGRLTEVHGCGSIFDTRAVLEANLGGVGGYEACLPDQTPYHELYARFAASLAQVLN